MIKEEAIRLPFSYAAGSVGGAYLTGLAEGRLLASHCEPCAKVLSPARSLCPFCGYQAGVELRDVGPGGVVESWTTMPDGKTFVLVRLDGADTAMLHTFVDDQVKAVSPSAQTSAADSLATITPTVDDRVIAVFDSHGLRGFEVTRP